MLKYIVTLQHDPNALTIMYGLVESKLGINEVKFLASFQLSPAVHIFHQAKADMGVKIRYFYTQEIGTLIFHPKLTLSLTKVFASAPFSRNWSHRSPDAAHSSAALAGDASRDSARTDAATNLPARNIFEIGKSRLLTSDLNI